MATKKQIEKIKKKVSQFCTDFEWVVSIQNYDRSVVYKEKVDSTDPLASIDIDDKYKRCTLNIYPCFYDVSAKEQAETLVHEFMHVLIYPIHYAANELSQGKLVTPRGITYAVEQTTSAVSELVVRLLDRKLKYAARAFKNYKQKR